MDREILRALSGIDGTLNVISDQLDKIIQTLEAGQN